MRLKLVVTVTFLVTASIAAFAQVDEPNNPAPPTIEDAQKLVQTIRGDEAKLKAYCELGALYEEVARAEERKDMKELDVAWNSRWGPTTDGSWMVLEKSIQLQLKVRS